MEGEGRKRVKGDKKRINRCYIQPPLFNHWITQIYANLKKERGREGETEKDRDRER